MPGVLRSLYVERRTGLLHVTRAGERASVCCIAGDIVYGDTTLKEAHLGETLVRHGLISEPDFRRAFESMSLTGRRLGQVLLDLGLLDADGLEDALALHVREVLLAIFCWREGAWAFEEMEREAFRGYDRPLKISTGEIILDAVWSISDLDVVRHCLGDIDRALIPSTDPLLRFQNITLNATDGFLLSRVDGSLTAREVLELAPVSPEEGLRSLLGLLYTGMIEYLPPRARRGPGDLGRRERVLEAFGSMRFQNHYEVLGLAPEARPEEILAAYFRLSRLFHPDGHHEAGLESMKDKLEALFARITEANRVLSNPALRRSYDAGVSAQLGPAPEAPEPSLTPTAPERVSELLGRAEEALAGGAAAEAAQLAAEAMVGAKGRLRRKARALRARGLLRGADGRRAAEGELKAALEEDPSNAEAHYLLGSIYRTGGAGVLAAASFRRALALKPRYPEAQAGLASTEAPQAAARPGVLKKLFR